MPKFEYRSLVSSEIESEPDVFEDEQYLPQKRRQWKRKIKLYLEVCFFTVSLVMFTFSLRQLTNNRYCTEKLVTPSPARQVHDDNVESRRFSGVFWENGKFKGPPSPEIDAAWDEITYKDGGVIRVTKEELKQANASEYAVEYREELGGGYMASVEALHQLHCLNLLRQATYESYYRDKAVPWTDTPDTLRHHLDHCIDNLRQKLMCDADPSLVSYVWVKGHRYPYPDFNVCRNFQKILDWTHEHNVYSKHGADVGRVEGALEMDYAP